MHTSVGFLAFASFLSTFSWEAALPEIPWKGSYQEARSHGQKVKKPLAVIVGAGKSGFQQLIQEGSLSSDVRKILANEYISVYLDSEKAEGEHVRSFQLALAKLKQRPGRARFDIHRPGPLIDHPNHLSDYLAVYQRGMAEVECSIAKVKAKPQ